MAYRSFIKSLSQADKVAVIEIGSHSVPYVDVRHRELHEPLVELVQALIRDIPAQQLGPPELRLLILALPQDSDEPTLALARQGIYLAFGRPNEPTSALLDRVRQAFQITGAAHRVDQTTPARTRGPSDSAKVFSQRPPWFDQQAFDERIRLLQQPWRDEDYWTSDS